MRKVLGSCHACGYPLAALESGEKVTCPNCLSRNIALISETPGGIPGFLLVAGVVVAAVAIMSVVQHA